MKTRLIANVRVGKAQVKPTAPSHVWGIREGNKTNAISPNRGVHRREGGKLLKATASRSTGVNPLFRNSIVPGAPRLTPM